MHSMNTDLYLALLAAGTPDEPARAAANAMGMQSARLDRAEKRLRILRWAVLALFIFTALFELAPFLVLTRFMS